MKRLAINGGSRVRELALPPHRVFGNEEVAAAKRVVESGVLSRFLGTWHEDFYGGQEIRCFEKEWADFFGVKHAISVNSATSGIFCAVGAAGIGPGDEVIVSPYTMTASSVAPLIYNAIPVFADIEQDYFCIDAESFEARITSRTKAIIVVDIFGLPYDAEKINVIAGKHGLLVIEDAAQAPGAKHGKKYAGTLGDIGIYSLNYHKHIHTGEGGMIVTNDDKLAEKMRLIRNHAEAVLDAKGVSCPDSLVNMLGFNYRMTELQAAIGREQLKKLSAYVKIRQDNVAYLTDKLSSVPPLEPAKIRSGCTHSFYVHPIKYQKDKTGIGRELFIDAVNAELVPPDMLKTEILKARCGYVKPLYLQPLYQRKTAYGDKGCPWSCSMYASGADYSEGICPVAELMYKESMIVHEFIRPGMSKKDLDDVAEAFRKVHENLGELR